MNYLTEIFKDKFMSFKEVYTTLHIGTDVFICRGINVYRQSQKPNMLGVLKKISKVSIIFEPVKEMNKSNIEKIFFDCLYNTTNGEMPIVLTVETDKEDSNLSYGSMSKVTLVTGLKIMFTQNPRDMINKVNHDGYVVRKLL